MAAGAPICKNAANPINVEYGRKDIQICYIPKDNPNEKYFSSNCTFSSLNILYIDLLKTYIIFIIDNFLFVSEPNLTKDI